MSDFQFTERDNSWLSFNYRVLQEAKDSRVPLYERLKFLAIYSSNLDEFFRVRVASMRRFKELKKKTRRKLDIKPKKALREIRKIVDAQQAEFGHIFRKQILPELEANDIFLLRNEKHLENHQSFVKQYFEEKVAPLLKPIFVLKEEAEKVFLENQGLYLVVKFAHPDTPIGLVNIPSEVIDRFVVLPSSDERFQIAFLDDIIRFNMGSIFKGLPVEGIYAIKVSRDAELYIDDEYSGDLVSKIKKGLNEREAGLPTRFLYDDSMPDHFLRELQELFSISKHELVEGARYHNFNDFFGFPTPKNKPHLKDKALPPLPHPVLEEAPSMFDILREKDMMVHFPYQKFDYVTRLLKEAVEDDKVETIQMTLYRVASKSAITDNLLKAVKKGKKVRVFMEAKARFDEESNLYWGDKLQEAGAQVRYSFPGIKVHTKLMLISRREAGEIRYYGYLGTGNFNEKTAKLYGDHGLLSADPRIAGEASQIFKLLQGKVIMPKCKHLLVSPFTTRLKFEDFIEREIENVQEGKEAYMILKMNSLEDKEMIKKLYEASQAGVKIKLIVRGICCLIPGIEGMSENIEVISIIDRFLEHARVYIFANGGKEKMYTASADWMTRNLDRRVEVAMPIYDKDVYSELRHIINLQLKDNVKARIIDAAQSNSYKGSLNGEGEIQSQRAIYDFLKEKIAIREEVG